MNLIESILTHGQTLSASIGKEVIGAVIVGVLYLLRKLFLQFMGALTKIPTKINNIWKSIIRKISKALWDSLMEEHMNKSLEKKFASLDAVFDVNTQKINHIIREHQATQSQMFMIMDEMRKDIKNELQTVLSKG